MHQHRVTGPAEGVLGMVERAMCTATGADGKTHAFRLIVADIAQLYGGELSLADWQL